jgi:hypothetical protein
MQFNLRGIAAFAIATTLAAIVLFTPTRSVSALRRKAEVNFP